TDDAPAVSEPAVPGGAPRESWWAMEQEAPRGEPSRDAGRMERDFDRETSEAATDAKAEAADRGFEPVTDEPAPRTGTDDAPPGATGPSSGARVSSRDATRWPATSFPLRAVPEASSTAAPGVRRGGLTAAARTFRPARPLMSTESLRSTSPAAATE